MKQRQVVLLPMSSITIFEIDSLTGREAPDFFKIVIIGARSASFFRIVRWLAKLKLSATV